MKLYPLPASTLTAWAAVPSMEDAVRLLGLAHKHLGAGLTGFEVMGQFALEPGGAAFLADARALVRPGALLRAAGNSDNESELHARAQFERLLETALEEGCVTDAVVAENLTQAHQLWHIRESIPLAQAEEGLNIKHDISIAVSRIPQFCRETDALLARQIPGVRLVNFGHLGDGNLHYNVQAPQGGDTAAFLKRLGRKGECAGVRLGPAFWRLDLRRAWRGQPQAGETGAVQVAGRPCDDAFDQARVGSAGNLMNPGRVLRP